MFYTKTKPSSVVMWHATTLDGKRRDFRLLTGPNPSKPTPHPVVWFSEDVKQVGAERIHQEICNPYIEM